MLCVAALKQEVHVGNCRVGKFNEFITYRARILHTIQNIGLDNLLYGLDLWGCASKSNISIIQRCQSKILRMIVDVPWYVSNATLHADLGISYVQDVIHQKCNNHPTRLETHENPLL
jgi:hypothetical protein